MKYTIYTDGLKDLKPHSPKVTHMLQIIKELEQGWVVGVYEKFGIVWDQTSIHIVDDIENRRKIISKIFGELE